MGIIKKAEGLPSKTYADPFSAFRGEMDRMFENFFGDRGLPELTTPHARLWGSTEMLVPSMDIRETDDMVELTAELPGMEEKEVDLSIANGVLTLRGEKKYEHEDKDDNVHVMERRYGSFMRRFRLPETVNVDAIKADYDKGVLKVTMPKKEETKKPEKKIKIGK